MKLPVDASMYLILQTLNEMKVASISKIQLQQIEHESLYRSAKLYCR